VKHAHQKNIGALAGWSTAQQVEKVVLITHLFAHWATFFHGRVWWLAT
jgi:hypothetical protein